MRDAWVHEEAHQVRVLPGMLPGSTESHASQAVLHPQGIESFSQVVESSKTSGRPFVMYKEGPKTKSIQADSWCSCRHNDPPRSKFRLVPANIKDVDVASASQGEKQRRQMDKHIHINTLPREPGPAGA